MRGILFFTGETGPLTDFIGGGMSHCEDRLAGPPEGFTLFSVKRRFSIPVAAARSRPDGIRNAHRDVF